MRPIVYNGVDLSGVCSAEVIEKVALPVEAETLAVPRRAGALLVAILSALSRLRGKSHTPPA